MKFLIGFLCLFMVACGPIDVTPHPLRPIAFHTCVAGATVWLDGALVPDLRGTTDANGNIAWPEFPADIVAFNLHATAPNMPPYGAVITITRSTEPLVIILGSCVK